jgi:hypothetical protein
MGRGGGGELSLCVCAFFFSFFFQRALRAKHAGGETIVYGRMNVVRCITFEIIRNPIRPRSRSAAPCRRRPASTSPARPHAARGRRSAAPPRARPSPHTPFGMSGTAAASGPSWPAAACSQPHRDPPGHAAVPLNRKVMNHGRRTFIDSCANEPMIIVTNERFRLPQRL